MEKKKKQKTNQQNPAPHPHPTPQKQTYQKNTGQLNQRRCVTVPFFQDRVEL